jgi:hypothetical protein
MEGCAKRSAVSPAATAFCVLIEIGTGNFALNGANG